MYKTIFFPAVLILFAVNLQGSGQPSSTNGEQLPAVVVLLPRRLDYNVLSTSIAERVSQLNAHKYWQAGYVACGLGLATAAWYYWPESKDEESASAADPKKITKTVKVTEGGKTTETTETTEQSKKAETFWQKEVKYHRRSLIGALLFATASALIASGKKTVNRFFYWWKTPNKVALLSVLFHASKDAFDSSMIRKKEGFCITDTDAIKRYNRVLRALQQFVIELSAQTIFLAQKEGVSIEYSIDALLEQFSRDIDAANYAITQATEPFVASAARFGNLLGLALETVGRIEDMYYGFREDSTSQDRDSDSHEEHELSSRKGSRRG